MSRVIQAIIDEAMKLESDLTTANECLDDVIAQREECKQQLALTVGELRDAQNALEGASSAYELQKLASHEFQAENTKLNAKIADQLELIRNLQHEINVIRNTVPAPGPWDNQIVSLPGVGFVLAIDLYRKGWLEQQINSLTRTAPMLLPTYNDWWYEHGKIHGWAPPQPVPPMPGLPPAPPAVVLSDDQSHWVAVPDDEPSAVPADEIADSVYEKRLEEKVLKARRRREIADE